ncbi:taste receptor type 2 member 114-like [Pelobates fuscus]|uniref:taste receptor type 2 member 114-like n=1 Tax=Pelobates fuscus TaxID=191477 RepID=UPI002FE48FB3
MSNQIEENFVFSVCIITFMLGLMVNTFILAVNVSCWLRQRRIKASGQIQCSLAISRLCFQFLFLYEILIISFQHILVLDVNFFLTGFCMLLVFYSNLWFAALLSAIYFLKIANYSHDVFLYLKRMLSQKMLYFICAAVLIASCNSSLDLWIVSTELDISNSTIMLYLQRIQCKSRKLSMYYLTYTLGNCGPFIINSISLFLLLSSLCRHLKQMKSRDTGFTRHLDSYYVAINSIAAAFVFQGLQFGTNIAYMFCIYSTEGMWIQMLLYVLPSLHSCFLIYITTNLRQQFYSILQRGANCFLRRRDADPNLVTIT